MSGPATGVVGGLEVRRAAGFRDLITFDMGGKTVAVAVYDRECLEAGHRLSGPAIIEQMDATTLLLAGQTAVVDPYLTLVVEA